MKRILTGAIGLLLFAGVWISRPVWAASPVNSCGEITQSGAYTLSADLQGAYESTCVHIHDVANVQLDCQGHTISGANINGALRLDNVTNFSVSNCNLIMRQGYGFLITNSNGGVISSNTIQGLSIDDDGGQMIGVSSNMQIVSNLFTDSYSQYYASHMTVQNNQVILSTSSNASGGMEFSNGSQNHVLQNTITGGSQIASNQLGGDDGIGLNNETSDVIQGNTVSAFWDCGLETTGLFSSSTISGNTFSNIGRCGIGGWYTNSWLGNTVSNNTVQNTFQFLALYRIFGLQPGETNVYFLNNSFTGNTFTASANTTQFGTPSGASTVDFQDQGAALIPPAQLILGNNVFTNNQFGTFQGPSGSIFLLPDSMIVDGGGNSCSLSADPQYPLSCGRAPLPNPPTGLTFNSATSNSLILSWTASTGSVAVSDYHVDVSTDASFDSFVGPYNNFDAGNAPAGLVIIGLQPSTTYYARARSYTAASISSLNSLVANGTTLSGPPPSITITSPTPGAAVFGREEIDVQAYSATSAIQRVDYFDDSQFLGSVSAFPYTFYFDTTVQPNGIHQVTATAYDVTGASASATIPLTVANFSLFQDNFNGGSFGSWTIVDDGNISAPSQWQVLNGALTQISPIHGSDTQARLGTEAVTGNAGWTDYSVSLRILPANGDAGVIFRRKDNNNYYRFSMSNDGFMYLSQNVGGTLSILSEIRQAYVPGQWVAVTIDVKSYQLHVFVNGQIALITNNGSFASGGIGLYTYNTTNASFDDVQVLNGSAPAIPNPPSGLFFNSATPSSLILSWTASTGSVAASDYHVDVSTDASFGSFVGPYNNYDAGNAPAGLVIIGLQPSTTYYARARAYDSSGDASVNSQTALGGTLNIPITSTATFLKTDSATQGNWKGVYGTEGEAINNDSQTYPSYARVNISASALSYTWANSTQDVRALQKNFGTDHIASTWYSSSNFSIDLNLTDGATHQFALYAEDWDGYGGGRTETIEVRDASTNTLLDSRPLSHFGGGQYLVWSLKGHVVLNAINTNPNGNVVINGFFFGQGSSVAPPSATATFLNTDFATQGNWKGVYGTEGEAINNDSQTYPSYAQVNFSPSTLSYTWVNSTQDVRALQKNFGTDRIASTWYSSSNFSIDLNLTDGATHQFALYAEDWDGAGGGRTETIEVRDASSNTLLDSRSLSHFGGGQYLVWSLKGHVVLNAINTNPNGNVVINGFFFGQGSSSAPPPTAAASFVKLDTTTQGTWKGIYGTEGEAINNDSQTYPSYAQVNFSPSTLSYTWVNSTQDVRALQKNFGTDRIASTWYSSSNFSIDLNLTDGATHQFALYAEDWDGAGGGRTETIEVRDASSNTLLDSRSLSHFGGGQYLVWSLKGHVVLNAINTNPNGNVVINGFFFDKPNVGTGMETAAALPAPTFAPEAVMPLNTTLSAGYPITYQPATFNWILQASQPAGLSAAAQSLIIPNTAVTGSVASLSEVSNQANLGMLNLQPGIYRISVSVTLANGQTSPANTKEITLVGSLISASRVYPNPFKANQGNTQIIFDQMPSGATVKIFTVSARWVATLTADANGKAPWNLTNDSGDKVASGIYLYLITDGQGNKTRGALTVIK